MVLTFCFAEVLSNSCHLSESTLKYLGETPTVPTGTAVPLCCLLLIQKQLGSRVLESPRKTFKRAVVDHKGRDSATSELL